MEVFFFPLTYFDRQHKAASSVLSDQTADFIVTKILCKLSPVRFFLKKPRGSTLGVSFIIWQSFQNLQVFFACAHTEVKKHVQASERTSSLCVREREREGEGGNTTLLLCPDLSQSHIRSDHWRIKALPDTSFPPSEGSANTRWEPRTLGWRCGE